MPNYSYSSKRVFSLNRWACVGEAGTFIDPLYSIGMDMIGFANSLTTEMIRLDGEGKLTKETVERGNLFFLTYNDQLTSNIQLSYQIFGKNSLVSALKYLWDNLAGWAFTGSQMFNYIFLDPKKQEKIQGVSGNFFLLTHRIQRLFQDWLKK